MTTRTTRKNPPPFTIDWKAGHGVLSGTVNGTLGALTTAWMLWFGLLFVALVLFKPEGIAGLLQGIDKAEPKRVPRPAAEPQPQPR